MRGPCAAQVLKPAWSSLQRGSVVLEVEKSVSSVQMDVEASTVVDADADVDIDMATNFEVTAIASPTNHGFAAPRTLELLPRAVFRQIAH